MLTGLNPSFEGAPTLKTDRYKYIDDWCLVPRECFLKTQLAKFLEQVHTTRPILIRGYQLSQRQGIRKLDLFETFSNNMRNGHGPTRAHVVHRCMTLNVEGLGIKGAIYLRIDAINKIATIKLLEVDKNHKRKHYGSMLLHCAVFIALHYQCTSISLDSTDEGNVFYPTQGFKRDLFNGFDLDFHDEGSRQLFLEKVKKTCSSFDAAAVSALLAGDQTAAQATPDLTLDSHQEEIFNYVFEPINTKVLHELFGDEFNHWIVEKVPIKNDLYFLYNTSPSEKGPHQHQDEDPEQAPLKNSTTKYDK